MKKILCLFILVFIFSCKSKQAIIDGVAHKELSTNKIIQEHNKNNKAFKTIAIRANAKYSDESQSHAVNADIRIQKDELIWINVKILGVPLAKALITPDKVSYYEKINHTYFEGDFSVLSNWLGTELDFNKVQNLLLGHAVDDLTKAKYETAIADNLYKLFEKNKRDTQKEFYFEASHFLLKKENISQLDENRRLEINYPSHQELMNIFVPNEIQIKAIQKEEINITLIYKNVTFNEAINTSFSIPEGYELVTVD